jgi:hypothetical protein
MVSRGLAPLISAFNDTNWQIAVISMSNPCVDSSNLIKKTDTNPSSKFADAVRKSVDWQATEQGFPMAIRALKGQCGNSTRPWLRANSSVGILFVSDEDNCGSDAGEQGRCANVEGKNADEMVNALRVIRPAEQGRMYAIIDKDGSCPDAGGIGSMYNDALAKTGGSAGSICRDYSSTSGYGEYLSSVSKDVSRIVKRQFRLSFSPAVEVLHQKHRKPFWQPASVKGLVCLMGVRMALAARANAKKYPVRWQWPSIKPKP